MIDIHTHILPGVDDGSDSWETSLAMARLAVKSGVTALAATPHSGMLERSSGNGAKRAMQTQLSRLREMLTQARIPLTIYEGMEIFATEDTARLLECGHWVTLNESRYPLIEFPFEHFNRPTTQVLGEVLALGYRPVIAHPERYRFVQTDPALLNIWVDMGCLLQVNRGSLLGRFGPVAEELSWSMVARGFVCTVASDAHASVSRTTWMKDIQDLLQDEFDELLARRLLEEHPAHLMGNEEIKMPVPNWF